jgi:hypothetical protein
MKTQYSTVLTHLLAEPRLPELGQGCADSSRRAELERKFQETVFGSGAVEDQQLGRACVAGLWLHFDFLDESHQISQQIHLPEGSYWHGVMHRREGDFGNASYWFRRAGDLPFQAALGEAVGRLYGGELRQPPLARLAIGDTWDPFRFVDICKACINSDQSTDLLCRKLQRLEWAFLFSFCYASAANVPWAMDVSDPGPFQL